MNLYINVVETCTGIPECMIAEEMWHTMQVDDCLNTLTGHVINGWLSIGSVVKEEIQVYYHFMITLW